MRCCCAKVRGMFAKPAWIPQLLWRAGNVLWSLTKEMYREYCEDSLGDQAAAMSFFTVLTIPAAALAMVTGLGSLEGIVGVNLATDAEQAIGEYVERTFGSPALSETVAELFANQRSGLLTVSLAVALYSLSRGFGGLVRGLDVAYETTGGRPWYEIRLSALGIALGSLAVVGVALYGTYALWPTDQGPWLNLIGLLLLFVLLTAWATTVFHIAPHRHTPWRWDVPGALFAAVLWVVLGRGFAVYVSVANDGNGAVGVVGAALLAFTLVYLLNLVFLLGAELNDILTRRAGVVEPPRPNRVIRRSRFRR